MLTVPQPRPKATVAGGTPRVNRQPPPNPSGNYAISDCPTVNGVCTTDLSGGSCLHDVGGMYLRGFGSPHHGQVPRVLAVGSKVEVPRFHA
jgi:hypothetical protein